MPESNDEDSASILARGEPVDDGNEVYARPQFAKPAPLPKSFEREEGEEARKWHQRMD
jgi:hypothetical protein